MYSTLPQTRSAKSPNGSGSGFEGRPQCLRHCGKLFALVSIYVSELV